MSMLIAQESSMTNRGKKRIEALGIKVLRYTNIDVVKNIEGVLYDIAQTTPHSPP